MNLTTYTDINAFLEKTQTVLETQEVVNSLMLGICLGLSRQPEPRNTSPYLAIVQEAEDLLAVATMTPPHLIIVQSLITQPDAAFELIISNLLARGLQPPGVLGSANVAEQFAEIYAQRMGVTYSLNVRERVFELRSVHRPAYPPGQLRLATLNDLDRVAEWVGEFFEEALGESRSERERTFAERRIQKGDIYLWDTGTPVSMAAKSRPTRHGITVNLVYTPQSLRGRGYASACVAALSQQLLDEGWQFCTLFTDLANPTSNSIYQKIGYQPICDFNLYRFSATAKDKNHEQ